MFNEERTINNEEENDAIITEKINSKRLSSSRRLFYENPNLIKKMCSNLNCKNQIHSKL